MPVEAVCHLMTTLQDLEALDPGQRKKLEEIAAGWVDPASGIRDLVKRGWITTYQANLLNKGKGKDLLVGPYLLLDRLGDGGMGEVYRARHRFIRTRVVALKVIREERLADRSMAPQIIGRFIREPEAIALLSHPNIVKVFDAGKDQGKYFMVMEYLEGTDLQRLVKTQGPLPLEQVRTFLRQALLGLEHLYQRGMVHRDIKPANLFVTGFVDQGTKDWAPGTQVEAQATEVGNQRADNKGQPPSSKPIAAVQAHSPPPVADLNSLEPVLKILDLGLALIRRTADDQETADELTGMGRTLGTPLYMAPEQAVHPHGVDIRADLYSLGRTFFYLITGKLPPLGSQTITIDLLKQQRPELPTSLATAVCRLAALAPVERFQTPGEALQALDKAQGQRPSALPKPPLRSRNYLAYLAAGAGSLVLLILLTWGLVATLTSRHTEPDGDIAQGKQGDSKEQGGDPKRDSPIPPPNDGGTVTPVPVPSIPRGKLGQTRLMTQHTTQVWSVAFVPGKNQALSCSSSETILWDLEKDNPLKVRTRFGTRDFDKPGEDMFPGGGKIPDLDDMHVPTSVAAAPNGKSALFGSISSSLTLWDLETWKKSQVFKFNRSSIVNCWVAYSADGRRGLYGNYNNVVHLIDVAKKEKLAASFPGGVACFSPDGAKVLTGDTTRGVSSAMLHLWDIDKKVRLKSFGDYRMGVSALAVSPNGKQALAAGRNDKEAILWDLESYTEIRRLKGHAKGIMTVALSSDGKFALTGSLDATARLWEVETGAEIDRFTQHTKAVNSVAFSPGDTYGLTGGEDQGVGVWQLKN